MKKLPELRDLDAVKYDWIEGRIVKVTAGRCYPIPEQDVFANDVISYMNIICPMGGAWRGVWLNPKKSYWDKESGMFKAWVPTMFEFQWLEHGAPSFVMELKQDIYKTLDVEFNNWATMGESAYKQHKMWLKDAGVRDDQIIKIDQGQVGPKNPLVQPII